MHLANLIAGVLGSTAAQSEFDKCSAYVESNLIVESPLPSELMEKMPGGGPGTFIYARLLMKIWQSSDEKATSEATNCRDMGSSLSCGHFKFKPHGTLRVLAADDQRYSRLYVLK